MLRRIQIMIMKIKKKNKSKRGHVIKEKRRSKKKPIQNNNPIRKKLVREALER